MKSLITIACLLGAATNTVAYNDYGFCREDFFSLIENGAENAGFSNATAESAMSVVKVVCSCDISDEANSAELFWTDMINGTTNQTQECEDVLIEFADSQDAFTNCSGVTDGDLEALYAQCPNILYDLFPADLYPYFANAADEISDCVETDTMSDFLDDLCKEDETEMDYSYSMSYYISYTWESYEYTLSTSYSYSHGYDPTPCAKKLIRVVRVMQGQSAVDQLRSTSCNLNADDILYDDEIVPDDVEVDDNSPGSPTYEPSYLPTAPPSTVDTTTLSVSLSMTASASPTDTDKTVLKAQILNQTSLSSNNLRNFVVTYTASTTRQRRNTLATAGTWDVDFDLVVSLATGGYSSISEVQTSVSTNLNQPSFSSKVKKQITSVSSIDSVTSVIQTRKPSSAPTQVPSQFVANRNNDSSEAAAASLQFILIGAGGFLMLLVGCGVAFTQYQKKQKAKKLSLDQPTHAEKDGNDQAKELKAIEMMEKNISSSDIQEAKIVPSSVKMELVSNLPPVPIVADNNDDNGSGGIDNDVDLEMNINSKEENNDTHVVDVVVESEDVEEDTTQQQDNETPDVTTAVDETTNVDDTAPPTSNETPPDVATIVNETTSVDDTSKQQDNETPPDVATVVNDDKDTKPIVVDPLPQENDKETKEMVDEVVPPKPTVGLKKKNSSGSSSGLANNKSSSSNSRPSLNKRVSSKESSTTTKPPPVAKKAAGKGKGGKGGKGSVIKKSTSSSSSSSPKASPKIGSKSKMPSGSDRGTNV